jgi:hypothetical protein
MRVTFVALLLLLLPASAAAQATPEEAVAKLIAAMEANDREGALSCFCEPLATALKKQDETGGALEAAKAGLRAAVVKKLGEAVAKELRLEPPPARPPAPKVKLLGKIEVEGDRATARIRPGGPDAPETTITLVRQGDAWKLVPLDPGEDGPEAIAAEAKRVDAWSAAFADGVKLYEAIAADVEAGKLASKDAVRRRIHAADDAFMKTLRERGGFPESGK